MTWLQEAHAEWHLVNGRFGCPLDCYESDMAVAYEEDFPGGLPGRHVPPVAPPEPTPEEEARSQEICEHGMAAWLCAGPMHYPPDRRD